MKKTDRGQPDKRVGKTYLYTKTPEDISVIRITGSDGKDYSGVMVDIFENGYVSTSVWVESVENFDKMEVSKKYKEIKK